MSRAFEVGGNVRLLFDDDELELEVVGSHPFAADMGELQTVSKLFGLTIF